MAFKQPISVPKDNVDPIREIVANNRGRQYTVYHIAFVDCKGGAIVSMCWHNIAHSVHLCREKEEPWKTRIGGMGCIMVVL